MLSIGQPAPIFRAPAVFDGYEVKNVSLDDFKGRWLVLFFYPLDFTFVCTTEILQFRDLKQLFADNNADILGVSVDSIHSHKRWIKDDLGQLGFPLVGDLKKQIAKDYGTLIESEGVATRSTYIIDPESSIQYFCHHSNRIGRDANEILRILRALQTEELCPAGWQPGEEFLSPS